MDSEMASIQLWSSTLSHCLQALIFFKYCDHENAAFKDVALVLIVLH